MHKVERYPVYSGEEQALRHLTLYTLAFYDMFENDPVQARAYWRTVERDVTQQFGLEYEDFDELASKADIAAQDAHYSLDFELGEISNARQEA
ncbi:MAG: hypothetical protein JWO41_253 [Candidatus Saccharibacteria bacterium]|nr:hypothetical protein [Candidatus Saccharibacteria bacterium]